MGTAATTSNSEPGSGRLGRWFLLATFATFAATAFAVFLRLRPSDVRFDSAVWKSSAVDAPTRRAMADDLLARYDLVGKTRAEIDALLGTPPRTEYFANFEYVYHLGPERGFVAIDDEWLGIAFADDVVVNVRRLRD